MPSYDSSMNDEDFLALCYRQILGRAPDADGLAAYQGALRSGSLSRDDILSCFLHCEEYQQARFQLPEYVAAGHYYSAVPSEQDRHSYFASKREVLVIPGVEFEATAQAELLEMLLPYMRECPFPAKADPAFRYHFENVSYSYGDGLTLYAMLRHLRPRRVIEIGSGYSSALMLDTATLHFSDRAQFTFIEPYADLLKSLLRPEDRHHRVIEQKLQEVDVTQFDSLEAGDILFIDSTHVGKLHSDVLRIFFEILPRIKPGVFVHIHDIFWPFEYPDRWIRERRAWNEIYLLRAFLQYNTAFRVRLLSFRFEVRQ